MNDIVKCEYPLPLPIKLEECEEVNWGKMEFHTDAFHGGMDEYEVTEDGEIYRWDIERKYEEDSEHPLGGYFAEVDRQLEKLEWTGELHLHGVHLGEGHDYLFEFKLTFYDGQLKNIERLSWNKENNAERIEVQKEFQEMFEKRLGDREKWWYKPYLIWVYIIKFLCLSARWVLGGVVKLSWKIEKWLT